MDSHNHKPEIDPLRRVFVPKVGENGLLRTVDGRGYRQGPDGTRRRLGGPKPNGKAERKRRAKARRQAQPRPAQPGIQAG